MRSNANFFEKTSTSIQRKQKKVQSICKNFLEGYKNDLEKTQRNMKFIVFLKNKKKQKIFVVKYPNIALGKSDEKGYCINNYDSIP